MKIFLIGLPGSGKTTIGKGVALALQLPFADLDKEIEKVEGTTIPEIFSIKKEEYYRKIESAQLKAWCRRPEDFVMATGGGAPCFFDNMQAINKAGISIFIDVSAREVARRMMKTDLSERPLLIGTSAEEVKDRIEFLRSGRIAFYKLAKITLSGDAITAADVIASLEY